MNDQILHIEQGAIEKSFVTKLQLDGLKELQRLSGEVWTNYNIHDPGVTTSDIANNALSELNYKLGFDLIDYLVQELVRFEPEDFGLFVPEKVYPTAPVTLKDYRKLLLSCFPMLEDVIIELRPDMLFEIRAILSPLYSNNDNELVKKITGLFNSNRNLCEMLGSVNIGEREKLYLHSEIEVRSKEEVTTVLAQIYWNILSYLSGGFHFEKYEKLLDGEIHWEELYEGPVGKKQLIIPQQENTMSELYGILCRIDGVMEFKTCYLAKDSANLKDIISDFKKGYSLSIPSKKDDLKVKVRIGEVEVTEFDFDNFINKLKALFLLKRSTSDPDDSDIELSRKFIPAGVYRHVYDHQNIAEDFPACYKVSLPLSDKNCNKQFSNYLVLFDLVFQRGLKELSNVKELLCIKEENALLSKANLITSSMKIAKPGFFDFRNTFALKNQYLDFLDHLYGVDSNPDWMKWGNANINNAETEDHFLKRRMNFLRNVPWLLQARAKAYNIYKPCSAENISTIKAYLSLLLGMNMDESIPASGILSKYNLELVENGTSAQQLLGAIDVGSTTYEEVLNSSVYKIDNPDMGIKIEYNREEYYKEFLIESKIFSSGKIGGELFRKGIDIVNYRIIPNGDEFELYFVNHVNTTFELLTSSNYRIKLEEWAILLTNFLYDMNSQIEVVYVLENHLFSSHERSVSFIFSASSARFSSVIFQENITQLIRTLLPAHLGMRVYWLKETLSSFELAYKKWTDALLNNEMGKLEEIETEINGILNVD